MLMPDRTWWLALAGAGVASLSLLSGRASGEDVVNPADTDLPIGLSGDTAGPAEDLDGGQATADEAPRSAHVDFQLDLSGDLTRASSEDSSWDRNAPVSHFDLVSMAALSLPPWQDEGQSLEDTGPTALSAEEAAKELANPNTALATLNFKNQIHFFDGDLPDADNQVGYTLLFQPSFPFPLENGNTIFFRPGIPLHVNQPVFDLSSQSFDDEFGLGDIGFDLAYGRTTPSGEILAAGMAGTLPTATSSGLGRGQLTLGPEVLVGVVRDWGVVVVIANHQWDIGGWGDLPVSLTTVQPVSTFLLGDGWTVGSAPIITYDWNADQWTVPLNLTVGKTAMLGSGTWKFSIEINYYFEQPDSFGPEWMIGINISPVVENFLAGLFE